MITADAPQTLLTPTAGNVLRCTLCDRVWPGGEPLLWHSWVMSATRPPILTCSCEHDDEAPRWHAFEVLRWDGLFLAGGAVCPKCITVHGLDAAVLAALEKARAADLGVN
jgi:hypothetical protein